MASFFIKSITVGAQCSKAFSKALVPGTYKLTEELPFDFYGSNISVCAIVGKNGAGKSTLLDILFRIINNMSCLLISPTVWRRAAKPLYFIPGLYASVEYVIDGNECQVECRGNSVGIIQGTNKYYLTKNEIPDSEFDEAGYEFLKKPNQEIRKAILKDFFFTVVTNYSLQALNSNDYKEDDSHEFRESPTSNGTDSDGNWVDSVFKKNDGYLMPLTFNPYRNQGKFDIQSETERTIVRLSAILIQAKKKKREVLDGYQLDDIQYDFDETAVCMKLYKHQPEKYIGYDVRQPIELYMKAASAENDSENNILHIILSTLGLKYQRDESLRDNACIYLGYKILSIASKYPKYEKYVHLGKPWKIFVNADEDEKKDLEELVNIINGDHSHIANKVHQTINFIKAFDEGKHIDESFLYSEYEQFVTLDKIKNRSVEGYMEILPPPIFKAKIYFNPVENGIINKGKQIKLNHLSSGERQYLYMISTLVYHVMNIKSVPTKIESYRNINLILDEVEICFHPDYQRCLVKWLVSTIRSLRLHIHCKFNIILTTHSPFILSDMMPNNVMYLKREELPLDNAQLRSPLAANVNELLRWSFFLDKGFMGEYVKNQVNSLLDYIEKGNTADGFWAEEIASEFIDMIGEDMLRNELRDIFNHRNIHAADSNNG